MIIYSNVQVVRCSHTIYWISAKYSDAIWKDFILVVSS